MGILQDVGNWLLDVLGFVGLGVGGVGAASKPDLAEIEQEAFHHHPVLPLSPDQLAAAVVKGVADQGQAAGEAELSGINADRFAEMVAITGNPPGPETLLVEWRLGRIDDATFVHGLRQGYLKDEWVGFYLNRRTEPLSLADYVSANVQGYVTDEVLYRMGAALGYDAIDVQYLQESYGNPPGPTEVLRMLNRGIIDVGQATQALRESRLKNKYIPAILDLAQTLVPARTITTLIGHGAIDDTTARAMLAKLGYTPEVITAFIASAHKAKTATTHDLTLANIRSLYEDRIIDRATAVADLVKLRYDATEAGELLDLADAGVQQRFRSTAISKVRSLFTSYKLERGQASTDLDSIGVPPGQRDQLLTLWDIERSANVKHLTVGELNQALKKGVIPVEVFIDRVKRMGYDDEDAQILAAIDIAATNTTSAAPAAR